MSKVFIRSLPYQLDQETFVKFFQAIGPVTDGFIPKDRVSGNSRGFGFITFAREEDAQKVIDREDLIINGRQVFASLAESERRAEGGDVRSSFQPRRPAFNSGNRNNYNADGGDGAPGPWNNQNRFNATRSFGNNQNYNGGQRQRRNDYDEE